MASKNKVKHRGNRPEQDTTLCSSAKTWRRVSEQSQRQQRFIRITRLDAGNKGVDLNVDRGEKGTERSEPYIGGAKCLSPRDRMPSENNGTPEQTGSMGRGNRCTRQTSRRSSRGRSSKGVGRTNLEASFSSLSATRLSRQSGGQRKGPEPKIFA